MLPVGHDTFTGVNRVRGSYFADTLLGSNNPTSTAEIFEGRGGDDFIDGRGGFDKAVYLNEDAADRCSSCRRRCVRWTEYRTRYLAIDRVHHRDKF